VVAASLGRRAAHLALQQPCYVGRFVPAMRPDARGFAGGPSGGGAKFAARATCVATEPLLEFARVRDEAMAAL